MKKKNFVTIFSAAAIVAVIAAACNSSNQKHDLSEQNSLIEGTVAESDGHVTAITSKNSFDGTIANNEKYVLVDFWASWCGPCKMIAPTVAAIAEEQEGKVKVGKVNVDEQSDLAARYGIASIPTIMVFQDGQVVNQAIGVRPKEQLEALLP